MKKTRLMHFDAYLFACGCLVGGIAQAEGGYGVLEDSDAPVIRAGGVNIYPGISLDERRNDNLFRSDVNKKSSLITAVSPSVLMQTKSGANTYSLAYDAKLARYAQSPNDNYDDQNFSANAEVAFSPRATLTLTPQIKLGHDDRGSTYSRIPTATPNRWENTGLAGSFTYGTQESIGRIQLDADAYSIRYSNNGAVTSVLDRDMSDIGGTFYYRISPKIYALTQLTETRISYVDPASTLSGKEDRILVGATWKAAAQTSGSFKIGQLYKKFDSAERTGFSGTSWEGSMRWSPREFAYVDWITGRKSVESTGVGDFILLTSNMLNFGYNLNERTSLSLNVSKLYEEFAQSGRSDSTQAYGLKAEYKLRKELVLAAEYYHAAKTSVGFIGTSPNFTGNIVAVSIRTQR